MEEIQKGLKAKARKTQEIFEEVCLDKMTEEIKKNVSTFSSTIPAFK